MSNGPEHPDYLSDHAVLRQIVADIKEFSFSQVIPSLILSVGAFLYAWRTGQVISFRDGLVFVLYSLAAGLAFYIVLAVIRAPIIVIGWHLRQISSLALKLSDRTPEPRTNSFTDFRVIKDGPTSLQFEFWYFYDGTLGNDNISIYASLENNGARVELKGGGRTCWDVSVVAHRALATMTLRNKTSEEKTGEDKTTSHIVLTMESAEKNAVFYRQLIPYAKVWQAST